MYIPMSNPQRILKDLNSRKMKDSDGLCRKDSLRLRDYAEFVGRFYDNLRRNSEFVRCSYGNFNRQAPRNEKKEYECLTFQILN